MTAEPRRHRRTAALLLIALGLIANEWLVSALLSPDGELEPATRVVIWFFDVNAVAAGLWLLCRRSLASWANAAVLVVAVIVSFGAAEAMLRLSGRQPWSVPDLGVRVEPQGSFFTSHPTLGYTHRPGELTVHLGDFYSFRATHDGDGRRRTGAAAEAGPPGRPGLWIFGCSFTYGWSLNDWETYPWLLQERLPEHEVVNFGINGYGTLHALIQLEEELEKRPAPAAVVVTYASFHDDRNTFSRTRRKAVAPWNRLGTLTQPWARLDARGGLVRGTSEVEYRPFPLARRSALVNFLEDVYNFYEKRRLRDHLVSRKLLEELVGVASHNGIPLVLAGISRDAGTSSMLDYFQARRVTALDISVDLSVPENNNEPHDSHPSALAHRRYAEALEGVLRSKL